MLCSPSTVLHDGQHAGEQLETWLLWTWEGINYKGHRQGEVPKWKANGNLLE